MNEDNQANQSKLDHIKNGRGEPACRAIDGLFCYWDHELKEHPGLEISPKEYHDQQRKDLRPSAFARLHLNEFASNFDRFVTRKQWDACFHPEVEALTPGDIRQVVYGVDASTTRDYTASVGVIFDGQSQTYHVVYCRVWKPQKSELNSGKPLIDLGKTIGAEIRKLHKRRQIQTVYYDNYQLSSIATELKREGVRMIEFPQTDQRIESDQALYDAIISRTIRHFNHPELNDHIYNAVAVEKPRGFRLAKEKSSKKIDAAVALSMALHGARDHRQSNFIDYIKGGFLKKLSNDEVDSETIKKRIDRDTWKDLDDS